MGWRDTDWAKYEAAKRGREAPKHSGKKPAPSDTRALIQAPAQGLAPFLVDPNLLPKRPPGMR